jgi:hypothetical protein
VFVETMPIKNAYAIKLGNRNAIVMSDKDWTDKDPQMQQRMQAIIDGHEIYHLLQTGDNAVTNTLGFIPYKKNYIGRLHAMEKAAGMLAPFDPYKPALETLIRQFKTDIDYIEGLSRIFPGITPASKSTDEDVQKILSPACTRKDAEAFACMTYKNYVQARSAGRMLEMEADAGSIRANCDSEAGIHLFSRPEFARGDNERNPWLKALQGHPGSVQRVRQVREISRSMPDHCDAATLARR